MSYLSNDNNKITIKIIDRVQVICFFLRNLFGRNQINDKGIMYQNQQKFEIQQKKFIAQKLILVLIK
ncbi:unnamed protein product [Paramecium pentaurelia]|uniref:Uncharacterized protein n=1 Tax=Paramecium pentaurelia TaxID=43138 RepID=A0A8S1TGW7_9CILI|nr:unnamed protein product [Paramecium pentaurelia]